MSGYLVETCHTHGGERCDLCGETIPNGSPARTADRWRSIGCTERHAIQMATARRTRRKAVAR